MIAAPNLRPAQTADLAGLSELAGAFYLDLYLEPGARRRGLVLVSRKSSKAVESLVVAARIAKQARRRMCGGGVGL